jgi:uncharacterized protein involved in exopolysaccharide biosynthesis
MKSNDPQLLTSTLPRPAVELPGNGQPVLVPGSPHQQVASVVILNLFWENRTLLWKCSLWGFAIALAVAFLIPKEYQSTTRLMPPDTRSSSGMAALAAMGEKPGASLASLAGNLLEMGNSGDLFVEILRSRTVQDRVVGRFDLRKVYGNTYWEDARKKLAKNTGISVDHKSGVITITITDHDPNRAAQIAKAYVEELDRLVSEVSTSSARRERLFIEQRMASVKQDLGDAEQQFSQFASKNAALDIKEQTKAMVQSASLLQGQLIAAQSELQGLEQIYAGNNVRVRSLGARVEELKRQLQKIGGTDSSLVTNGSKSDELYPSIRQLPLLGVQWADLYRRMKIQETVFEMLNQQYELARIQESKEIPVVRVMDEANVPERKSFPPRSLVLVLLTSLSLTGAMAWVYASWYWRDIDSQDPRKLLAHNVWKSASAKSREVVALLPLNGHRAPLFRESRKTKP